MPEICRFDGMRIVMYFGDHPEPHFHVRYSGLKAVVDIRKSELTSGHFPPKARRRLLAWTRERQEELLDAWDTVMADRTPNRIAPPSR